MGRADPIPLDPRRIERLRAALRGAGYAAPAIAGRLGLARGEAPARGDIPVYVRRLASAEPLNVLIAMFMLGLTVDAPSAATALDPLSLEDARALGIVRLDGDRVEPAVGIGEHDGTLVVHDLFPATGGRLAADHVLGISAATLSAASYTVGGTGARALDLGTGSGLLALTLARANDVVGADINPRALAFLRCNALLNEVTVDAREGDLFAPVAGESFDRIVANPPFVISPERDGTIAIHSRMEGDGLTEAVLRGCAEHLSDGGIATVLCNWVGGGASWPDRVTTWLRDAGCDVWVIRSEERDPVTYAAVWNRTLPAGELGPVLDRWAAHLRAQGIESISMGAVIVRKRAGRHWVRTDDLRGADPPSGGDHLLRVIEGMTQDADLDDRDVLASRWRLVDDHRLERTGRVGGPLTAVLTPDPGLGLTMRMDGPTFHLVEALSGRVTGEEIAVSVGRDAGLDAEGSRRATIEIVRHLLRSGLLARA